MSVVIYFLHWSENLPSSPSLSQLYQEMNSGTCVGQSSWRTASGEDPWNLRRVNKMKGQGHCLQKAVKFKRRSGAAERLCVKGG